METGGMKGRRKEITREELHRFLKKRLNISEIHSEYGMTELLSQAYSRSQGIFYPAPTMRVFTREVTDPLTLQKDGRTGAINIIDLANLDTISFIATEDLGKRYANGSLCGPSGSDGSRGGTDYGDAAPSRHRGEYLGDVFIRQWWLRRVFG